MTTDNLCTDGGLLVGTEFWLPEDPSERNLDGPELVGCNRLFCKSCRTWVRHLDKVMLRITLTDSAPIEALYLDPHAEKDPRFRSLMLFRVYLCRCTIVNVSGAMRVTSNEETREWWSCAGHPEHAAEAPVNPPQPADAAGVEALLRARAPGPPAMGDDAPWDFALRWRQPFILRVVWPVVAGFTLDRDPVLRKRALEFVTAWPVGDAVTTDPLMTLANKHALLYQTPELRTLLINTLAKKVRTMRLYRDDIASSIVQLLAGDPPYEEAAILLPQVKPDAVVASAKRWPADADGAMAAKDAAATMALFQRDHVLALLQALRGRDQVSRERIAKAVAEELARPDDVVASLLASEDIAMPATHPTIAEARAALGLP